MNKLVLTTILLLSLSVNAEPTAVVKTYDRRMSTEQFKDAGFKSAALEEAPPSLPPAKELDALFAKSGVASHIKKWDRVDRDMLALSAKTLAIEELAQNYKTIPRPKLARLQALIR